MIFANSSSLGCTLKHYLPIFLNKWGPCNIKTKLPHFITLDWAEIHWKSPMPNYMSFYMSPLKNFNA